MPIQLRLSPEQAEALQRIELPLGLRGKNLQASLNLTDEEADELRELVADRLLDCGFDRDYRPTAEGRVLEGLIDALFTG